MRKLLCSSAAVIAALAFTASSPAIAADTAPTLSGPGWNAGVEAGIKAISPDLGYTITFQTQTARDHWAAALERSVAQYQALGVHLTIGGVEPLPLNVCPPAGRVLITEAHDPAKPNYSQGLPCADAKGVAVGGMVRMDTSYTDGTHPLNAPTYANAVVHEVTHAMGMGHSNSDVNGDGKVADNETVKNTDGTPPVMRGPSVGGYQLPANFGKLTTMDRAGVSALLANYELVTGS
ncbi:hypothetical protein [Streptomyces sp. NPDC101393]|uniref:hypothetical protein n=1 Tax=Streptomyces sp. NPDC101393 TaxID=3366141 RepID=UPI00382454DE